MKITAQDLSQIADAKELQRFLSISIKDIVTAINGKIAVNENLDVNIVSASFSGSNVTVAVGHGLGRVPIGYIVGKSSSGIIVFDGSGTSTDKTLFVQASGAGTVSLIVF